MKDKLVYILISVAVVIILVFIVLLFVKNTNKEIKDITHLRLSFSNGYSAYSNSVYTIDLKDGKYIATVKPNGEPEENTREFEISKEEVKALEKVLTDNNVYTWDNFHESDKYVLDGDSFSFSLDYGDKKSISASGYMRWPKNYRIISSYISQLLNSK